MCAKGGSFTLNGIIGGNILTEDCGMPPYYIPAGLSDSGGCVGMFNETFHL